jgi:hypothetical protein
MFKTRTLLIAISILLFTNLQTESYLLKLIKNNSLIIELG